MEKHGKIKWFSHEKGEGYVTDSENKDYIFNITGINGADIPEVGSFVEFDVNSDNEDNIFAFNISKSQEKIDFNIIDYADNKTSYSDEQVEAIYKKIIKYHLQELPLDKDGDSEDYLIFDNSTFYIRVQRGSKETLSVWDYYGLENLLKMSTSELKTFLDGTFVKEYYFYDYTWFNLENQTTSMLSSEEIEHNTRFKNGDEEFDFDTKERKDERKETVKASFWLFTIGALILVGCGALWYFEKLHYVYWGLVGFLGYVIGISADDAGDEILVNGTTTTVGLQRILLLLGASFVAYFAFVAEWIDSFYL